MVELYSDYLGLPSTDPSRWRLNCTSLGETSWKYISEADSKKIPQCNCTKWLLNADNFSTPEPDVGNGDANFKAYNAAYNGASFLKLLQNQDSGTFPNQYKGPMFMTICYVGSMYVGRKEIPECEKIEIIRYIVNTAHPVDGGWGLHTTGKSTVFGTVLNYIVLRLLGMSKDHVVCRRARSTLHRLGGAIGAPHWGKIWLSILNLYKWEGVNPAPAEFWTLPYIVPIHPARWWIHTRAIYLPMSYLCGISYACELTPLLQEIRNEIYTTNFDEIQFSKHRNTVCQVDLYFPHSTILNVINSAIVWYQNYLRPDWLVKYSNKKVYELIRKEIVNTEYLCVAPVSAAFCSIVTCIEEGADSPEFERLMEAFAGNVFHGPQGMTVMGTNGSQVWDCSFFVQYLFMANLAELPEFQDAVTNAYKFLCRSQFTHECVSGSYRDKRVGGWPFSTKTQGYTVSDCTAEALKAVIMVKRSPVFAAIHDEISEEALQKAIDVLLSLQNVGSIEYGSFATYEKIRAPLIMEKLNPAEVFENIMVEYPYVECTDSCILGLTYFSEYYDYRKDDIDHSVKIAADYIKKVQGKDGSWYGCWGICYTYAGMFALEALYTIGENYENSEVVRRGCDFLVKKQLSDGGWSESIKSAELMCYINDDKGSLVVPTSWALIGLLLADYPDKEVIDRGIQLLKSRQLRSGEWKFEQIEGIFNHSCAIEYPTYRFLFPIKALGIYAKKYGKRAI
ncbi:lanosterol synthase ERG7 Ecym_8182 [Eremothecium cymbalariae DBVPG|uniref:Terpene cyclase/mutase family member n=1 Tax=Eremothecium cymbalariae (strain CBS 270.75 / DBVPG 7215 / KCTC 17166 / NRRL Y-17582) TaxID=931890 RepID=G8JX94_ERECY|nr:Hypothetical protein Ecym_8182 [Eremothecium cymbalariae DBVPG\